MKVEGYLENDQNYYLHKHRKHFIIKTTYLKIIGILLNFRLTTQILNFNFLLEFYIPELSTQ